MTIRFTKANTTVGHDAFWAQNLTHPRVIIKPNELPLQPLFPEDHGFWQEFIRVMDKVAMAKETNQGGYTAGVSAPIEKIGVTTCKLAADYVGKDRPGEIMMWVAKNLSSPWAALPQTVQSNFIDRVGLLQHLLGMGATVSMPSAWAAKWTFMVPRPEEVAGAIARGQLSAPDFVVAQLYDCVSQADLVADQRKFAYYPTGCPPHPSFPGGHATHAGWEATVLKLLLDLTPTDRRTVNLSAMNIAHFREIAGVHYRQDDVAGLMIGEQCAKRYLAGYMNREFGVPAASIQARLDAINTDWGQMYA